MITIFMASLGCAKNLVDAETMLGETLGDDFALAVSPDAADVVIVNTCGFIQDARDEARAVIREYLDVKARRPDLKVVATGCWAERDPDTVMAEFPALDAVWGLGIPSSLADAIRALGPTPGRAGIGKACGPREGARLVTTLPSFAYLRLSDGCDNRCHYCAIPLIRGGLRSREPGAILDEARSLEQQGARELVLISQDTTAYANDLGRPGLGLASLVGDILQAVRIPRIRILYAHPAHLDDEVMALLKSEPRLCRYLDLPIQHIADGVLRNMNRGYTGDRVREIVERLSGDDFTLRTTILAGFPGEGEADFRQALELVESGAFRHVGAFAYSPEPGTPAFAMPNPVPAGVAAERRDAILAAQAANAFAWLDSRVGGEESVLVDSYPEPGWLVARSVHEAPDCDGIVYVRGKARPGDVITACIKAREAYDLLAETTAPASRTARGGGRSAGKRGRRR
ncbi:MAG: 30S ribosomal protein S12 methylthiotransferase RimO [Planctomycetaceae bacterium]|nr:30S ribosomal protein S12 methylthiotransferase RimO [Planctomycetaceae bacterium]